MIVYIVRRLIFGGLTLVGVTVFIFSLLHITPGDPISAVLPEDTPEEIIEQMRALYGFDRPAAVQYVLWLKRAAIGDLGKSIMRSAEVADEVGVAMRNTFFLALVGWFLGFAMGVVIGTLAALFQGRWVDKVASSVAIAGVSVPHYWVGMVLIVVFAVHWSLLPPSGMRSIDLAGQGIVDTVKHMVLPAITLSLIPMGIIARMVRSGVLEVLSQEFIVTLRSKGLRSRTILVHILKNASPPLLTVMGLQIANLVGGSVLVETVFSWPGAGRLLALAISQRDFPLIQGIVLVIASSFVFVNIVVDLTHSVIDPRIQRT